MVGVCSNGGAGRFLFGESASGRRILEAKGGGEKYPYRNDASDLNALERAVVVPAL